MELTALAVCAAAVLIVGWTLLVAWRELRWGDWPYAYYEVYRRSRRWRTLRAQVLRRDRNKCRWCGVHLKSGMHVHHFPWRYRSWLFYRLRLPEWKRDLIALCPSCHGRAHGKETRNDD